MEIPQPYLIFSTATLAIIITTMLLQQILKLHHRHNSSHNPPPGSRGLPLIGETLQFMAAIRSDRGFYDFVRTRSLRHGSCFKTNIFGSTHVFVSSVESAKAILNNESGRFSKRYIRSIAELVGEKSLLLCGSRQHHKTIRGRLMSLVSPGSVGTFVEQFDELVVRRIASWEDGSTVVVLDHALQVTFEAMCKMLMGLESGVPEMKSLYDDVSVIYQAMLAFPLRLPWTRFYKGLEARKRVMKRLERMISERRQNPQNNDRCDFLQQLLLADGGSNGRLTDEEIKDNILTLIIAGQDTTASAITWMVKYLGENPDVVDTLRTEQLGVLERTSRRRVLTAKDLSAMPYATKVIKESLRMASIVPWFPRQALEDCHIEGYKIMKGWSINVDARSIHFNPNLYNQSTKFDPSRFDEEEAEGIKGCSFLAFGMGGRSCLGMNLARPMMLIFLHRLVTTYGWEVVDSDSSIEKWAMFSRLITGCPIHLTRIT